MAYYGSGMFNNVINIFQQYGILDVALPFLLIFTIIFAILQKVKIFGPNGKNFNSVIAIVLAFLVVRNQAIVGVLNEFLPKISLISVIIVVTLLLFAILSGKEEAYFTKHILGIMIILVALGIGVSFFGSGAGEVFGFALPDWLDVTSADRNLLIFIVLFVIFFAYVTSDSSTDKNSPWKFLEDIADSMQGKSKEKK